MMLKRFASASMVAAVAVTVAVLVVLVLPGLTVAQFAPLLVIWCCAPCAWGVWAMLAPSGWVPERLAIWGAILGVVAGVLAAFVLNLPLRVFGAVTPVTARAAGVAIIVFFYFIFWRFVGIAYRKLVA
jgi:hypothetical protein